MAKGISDAARSKIAVMRTRAQLALREKEAAAKKAGRATGGGRQRGGALLGILPTGEWGSVIAGGGVALLGGLTISRFFTGLPRWLSPSGVALWLWGWWRGIPMFRWAGLFLIALAVAEWLGITQGLQTGINTAMQRMGQPGAPQPQPQPPQPQPQPTPTPGVPGPTGAAPAPSSDVQQAVADLTAALNLYQAAQTAFA